MERRRPPPPSDCVVFENVADQYIIGADVIAFFTIQSAYEINPNEDQIGLIRVSISSMKFLTISSFSRRLVAQIFKNVLPMHRST